MPLPGNREATPFKTMDIKTALLSSGSRKRKAPSPQMCKSESKNLKLSVEKCESDGDVKILDEACGITVTIDQSELESNLGDCKENKDLNATKSESSTVDCKENKLSHNVKDELSPHVNKTSCNGTVLTNLVSPKSSDDNSDIDVDLLSEKSKLSDNSSCDELNIQSVSLNTSGVSVTGEEDEKGSTVVNSNISNKCGDRPEEESKKNETKERAKKKKMTPAEAQKRAEEREQMQKERLLKKQELENKKKERLLERERKSREKRIRKEREELERKERERVKQEKKEQEEQERLQKQKEKEEKLKMKQMMLEQKMEEKKKKEELKQKREEELKKAEDEKLRVKLEKEQKEREKKERAKAEFLKFFVKGDAQTSAPSPQVTDKDGQYFLPFQVSNAMRLAPVIPAAAQERFNKKKLDHYLEFQDGKELYLQTLKSGSYHNVKQRRKSWKLGSSDADILMIDMNAQAELGLRAKLLQFSENVRPPYWGTWRKNSRNIRPRNPFGQDEIFDYSVDSDDEWDEGGPGESLSESEQEVESEDEYDIDNEFFVPHGYLSDEEEKKEDDDEEVQDPEKQKALLKLRLQQFETERKKQTTELKPIILGCYFVNDPAFQDNGIQGLLAIYSAEFLSEGPIPTSFTVKNQQSDSGINTTESPKSLNSNVAKKVPEEAFPQLILLVHGNIKKRRILAEEFQKFWFEQYSESQEVKQEIDKPSSSTETDASKETAGDLPSDTVQISLRQLMQTIKEIASYGKPPESSTFNKYCWWVHDAIREKYGVDAPIPNQWKYVSQKEPEPQAKANCASIKGFLSNNQEK